MKKKKKKKKKEKKGGKNAQMEFCTSRHSSVNTLRFSTN